MFNLIRWRLTAWYVAVLLLIVAATSGISYVMLSRALGSEVDDSLRSSARNIASQLNDDALQRALNVGNHSAEREESESEEEEGLRFFSGRGSDTFYLILSPDGQSLLNPLNLSLEGIPNPVVAQEAVQRGEAWQTVSAGNSEYRTYLLPVTEEGHTVAVVQVGRSLAEHDRQLKRALLVLAISAATGLALATGGGLLVAGRALKPIRQAFSRQREFVADASHELRTPLTLVQGNAEMLALSPTAKLSPDDREFLTGIVREAEHMKRLVGDLAALTRMDEGRLPMERQPLDLAEVVDEVASQTRLLAADRRLEIRATADSPLLVEGDRARLRQLLLALMDNAMRVTPAGGRIVLEGRAQNGHVKIQVSDTGPGIPAEDQERIFERFYRTEKSRARALGGFGLGLSIAKGIAEAHGGTLTVVSQPGQGATFALMLPAARDSGSPPESTLDPR